MKKYLLSSLVLLTTLLQGQIPDSLLVTLPWDYIYVNACTDVLTDKPTSPRADVYITAAEVQQIDDAEGTCNKLIRTWTIVNWNDSATYKYTQIVKVDETVTIITAATLNVQEDELPVTLHASDLVTNYDPSHIYSFSMQDITDTERILTAGDRGVNILYIYDHSTPSVSSTAVSVFTCADETEVIIPEEVDIEVSGVPYRFVTFDMLDVSVTYTCGDYWYDIDMGVQGAILFASQAGESTSADLTLTFSDGTVIEQEIKINVIGEGVDPIPFYIEDVSFEAGETVELDIWTESLDDLVALQFRLNVQNANIVDLVKGVSFDNVPFNIFNDAKTINLLWTPSDAQAMDVPSNETWFTLVVEPTVAGSTFDIFTTTNDPWSSIGIEDEQLILEYEPEFVFNIAPRDFLNSTDEPVDNGVRLEQRVVDQHINILTDGRMVGSVTIYDAMGYPVHAAVQSVVSVSHLMPGIYFASITIGSQRKTLKFVKI